MSLLESSPRVALFPSAFHPHLGGVEELSKKLAHQLAERDALAGVWTIRWPLDLAPLEHLDGISVRRHRFVVPARPARALVAFPVRSVSTMVRIVRELRSTDAELIHVQCVSGQAIYAWIAARLLGLPFVVSTQGEFSMDATGLYTRSAVMRAIMRITVGRADVVTGCSRQTVDEVLAFTGRRRGGTTDVVYNGVSLAELRGPGRSAPEARPYVVALGRHVVQKGFDVLIRAFVEAGIGETHDLVIAGDGEEHQSLIDLAASLGAAEVISFPGRADRAEVARLLAGADVFVLPSRHEPMGIVNLEAMAAGAAVIASNVGGVPELVEHDRTGLLVPAGDVDALAAALSALVSDPERRARLGAAASEWVARFDWPVITDQYVGLYRVAGDTRRRSVVGRLRRRLARR